MLSSRELGEGEMCGGLRIATQVLDERYAPFIDLFAELDPAEQTRVVGDMLRRKNKNKKVPDSGTGKALPVTGRAINDSIDYNVTSTAEKFKANLDNLKFGGYTWSTNEGRCR